MRIWIERAALTLLIVAMVYGLLVVGRLAVGDQMAAEYATCAPRC